METIGQAVSSVIRTKVNDKVGKFLSITFPKISPNKWTTIGLLASLVAAFIIFKYGLFWGAFAMFFASLIDSVDGSIARAKNSTTSFGAFFDEVCDRFGEMFIFAAIFWIVEKSWSVYIAPISSFMASYIGAAAKARGFKPSWSEVTGRPGRIVLLFLLMVASRWFPITQTLWLLVFLNIYAIIKRWLEVKKQSG
jgi:phosphatidylglycerophosphate synthase